MHENQWSGTIFVNISHATKLKDADLLGKSDPFTKLTVMDHKEKSIYYEAKTHTIYENLNPVWKSSFVKHLSGSGPLRVLLEVRDEDDITKDEFLGKVGVDFDPVNAHEETYQKTLMNKKLKKKTKGQINFTISWVPDVPTKKRDGSKDEYVFKNGKRGKVVLGPVLLFRGIDAKKNLYHVSFLAVYEGDGGDHPELSISPSPVGTVEVAKLLQFKNRNLWRYTFAVTRHIERQSIEYHFNGKKYDFEVPGFEEPPRTLFISCNGFHEPPKGLRNDSHHMWKHIISNHREMKTKQGGYHLLIQGGDQVYADPIFTTVDLFKKNKVLAGEKGAIGLVPNGEFYDQVETFYMDLYVNSWSNEFLAEGLATIPSVMMWDDHDIFDGWGSYSQELMNSPTYTFVGKMAERYFSAFQLGATAEELREKSLFSALQGNHTGKTQVFRMDKLGIVCLDLRSERQLTRVCTAQTYECFDIWMKENSEINNLLLVLSIPIVYNDFELLEQAISHTGLGKELYDDLKDHWRTPEHCLERKKLLQQVFTASDKYKFRTTILSGDVHIGCAGVIYDENLVEKSNAGTIYSLISSAVVNVPPPPAVVGVLELTGNEIEKVLVDANWKIKAGLIRFLHDKRKTRYIPGRNFLELLVNSKHAILCRWFSEDQEDNPFELYIHQYTEETKHLDFHLISEDWQFVKQVLGNFFKSPPKKKMVQAWKKK